MHNFDQALDPHKYRKCIRCPYPRESSAHNPGAPYPERKPVPAPLTGAGQVPYHGPLGTYAPYPTTEATETT